MGLLDRLSGRRPKREARHHLASRAPHLSDEDREQADALWDESKPDRDSVEAVEQFTTTVQALRSLAVSHASTDPPDTIGARMLEDFAARFAEHEITLV